MLFFSNILASGFIQTLQSYGERQGAPVSVAYACQY